MKNFPYHLFIMAILPIVSLYALNIEQMEFAGTARSLIIYISVTLMAFAFTVFILRKTQLAALLVSFGLFLFYFVVPFQAFLIDIGLESLGRIRYLLPVFLLIFIVGVWGALKWIVDPVRVGRLFNLMALSTLVLPLFQIGSYLTNAVPISASQVEQFPFAGTALPPLDPTKNLPDVYYILLDAHGRTDDIRINFDYDNTASLTALENMGFYVAQCSKANYPDATWQSMLATLSMRYFDHEQIKTQPPLKTYSEGVNGIKNNEVRNRLEQLGYVTVNFNTTYDFLNMTDADYYYDFTYFPGTNVKSQSKFESLLLSENPLGLFVNNIIASPQRVHYENVLQILEKLPELSQDTSAPKFVYAHILVPHAPFVFSSRGEYVADNQDEFSPQKYANQVAFIDEQLVSVSRQIIENSPTPPIIIIQGDHGFQVESIQPGGIGNRSAILNTYYFPGVDYSKYLYQSISPVNTFRLVFKLYFNEEISLLEDTMYVDHLVTDKEHINSSVPYDFKENILEDGCSIPE